MADPAVRVVIDTSLMTGVSYDPEMGAFAIEPGVTLGEAYRKLYLGWGVTIPAGVFPVVGVGGHIPGGGHGCLCRQHGLASDHLYGIEVVVVDEVGIARSVRATREANDPNRDLWWAHTGGGGGNFGIVTRYWFRSLGASGIDPAGLLPKAPSAVLRCKAEWNWEQIDEAAFTRLVRNYGEWCERNSAPHSSYAALWSVLQLNRRALGKIDLRGIVTVEDEAEQLLDAHLTAINEGVGVPCTRAVETISWLTYSLIPFPDLVETGSQSILFKLKDAWLRKPLTDRQIAIAYDYLTRADYEVIGNLGLETTGGWAHTVAPDATASAQRDAILRTGWTVAWQHPQDEARSLTWLRTFYRDAFADTGGVPVPGEVSDGAFINHPDVDLADPEWNTSGVPWYTLYYKDNYPRLQQIKARWDPRNVFHHALSIRFA